MASVTFDHKIRPRNDEERNIIEVVNHASKTLAEYVDVDVTVRVERMNGWGTTDARYLGKHTPGKRLIKINLRNLQGFPVSEILRVLGHEFRHAYQDQHRAEYFKRDRYTTPDQSYDGYRGQPNEVDARNYERAYAEVAIKALPAHYDVESIISGERAQIVDMTATLAQVGIDYKNEDHQLYVSYKRDANGDYVRSPKGKRLTDDDVVTVMSLATLQKHTSFKRFTKAANNWAWENKSMMSVTPKVMRDMLISDMSY